MTFLKIQLFYLICPVNFLIRKCLSRFLFELNCRVNEISKLYFFDGNISGNSNKACNLYKMTTHHILFNSLAEFKMFVDEINWPKVNLDGLREILVDIRSKSKAPIFVFGPKMVFSKPIPYIVHACRSASSFTINKFAQNFAEKKDRNELNDVLIKFFEEPTWRNEKIYFINTLDIQGNGENNFDIISRENSDFLYFDPSHFTEQGAKEFGAKLKEDYPELFDLSFTENP